MAKRSPGCAGSGPSGSRVPNALDHSPSGHRAWTTTELTPSLMNPSRAACNPSAKTDVAEVLGAGEGGAPEQPMSKSTQTMPTIRAGVLHLWPIGLLYPHKNAKTRDHRCRAGPMNRHGLSRCSAGQTTTKATSHHRRRDLRRARGFPKSAGGMQGPSPCWQQSGQTSGAPSPAHAGHRITDVSQLSM